MSWDRYLALSIRRRWVMHDELVEMLADQRENAPNVEEDGEPPGAPMRPKRFRR